MSMDSSPRVNLSKTAQKPCTYPIFVRFILYNLIFLIIQFSIVYSKSSSFIHAVHLPTGVYVELIFALCVHFGLYILLSLLQTALLWGLIQHRFNISIERWQIIIWSLSICAMLSCNAYFFPQSTSYSFLLSELPSSALIIVLMGSLGPLFMLMLNALFFIGSQHPRSLALIVLLSISCIFYPQTQLRNQRSTQPNIIIIGVDSLPPKEISMKNTPTMAKFIKHSVQFKETISPLARTYPAWSSILTGLYPLHHGARYNLMPFDKVKSSSSIGWFLQKKGYKTIFATDDRQFNNMGREFGFQEVIGPKVGVTDLLLGVFNDFPLSNLIINFPIARWLFPYNHLNRASKFSYYPQTFDQALQNRLAVHNQDLPLFIAVHFTLPHWPYSFASSPAPLLNDQYNVTEQQQLIVTAIKQADKQVAHLLQVLQKNGYLENSLVVLLSDHGETLYVPGTRQTRASAYQNHGDSKFADYLKRKTATTLEKSAGHGADLLSRDQYHCVLAFTIYKHGKVVSVPRKIDARVALIDIAPTIQSFSGLKMQSMDGVSLLSSLYDKNATPLERAFIMESGMLPNQLITSKNASRLGRKFFSVEKQNNQLQIREREIKTLDALKLYGIIEGDWVLALYPDDDGYIPVIQRLSDDHWVDDLTSDFARSSPALALLKKTEQFYKWQWRIAK